MGLRRYGGSPAHCELCGESVRKAMRQRTGIMKGAVLTRSVVLLRRDEHLASSVRPYSAGGMSSIFGALAAGLVLLLVLFCSPSHGLSAEDNSHDTPAAQAQSGPSAKKPKKDEKPTILKCPRCGSTEIRLHRCTQCGHKLRTRRARTNSHGDPTGTNSKLRSLKSSQQYFDRSMRSLNDSVRRMNTDINRTRTLIRQFR